MGLSLLEAVEQKPELVELMKPRVLYTPHMPTERQQAFLWLSCLEAFYGGAAGGGKSDALLMAALQYVDQPNYAALILRRSYADLNKPDALIPRAKEWLLGKARWDAESHTFVFPSGATLSFGYLQKENDRERYQGAAYDYIGWDELGQFEEIDYQYLYSRVRRLSGSKIPPRIRGAGNPGGIGHQWVKSRFITGNRVFIPARLEDNPHIDQESYLQSLAELDPITYQQLRNGDWDISTAGGMFARQSFGAPIDAVPDLGPGARWVRYWDLAGTEEDERGKADPDWTVGTLMALGKVKTYVADVVRLRGGPDAVDSAIKTTALKDGRKIPIRIEQEPGASGKNLIAAYARDLRGWDLQGRRVTGSKEVRARPWSAAVSRGEVVLVAGPWNADFITTHVLFPNKKVHDDDVDSAAGAYQELTKTRGGLAVWS